MLSEQHTASETGATARTHSKLGVCVHMCVLACKTDMMLLLPLKRYVDFYARCKFLKLRYGDSEMLHFLMMKNAIMLNDTCVLKLDLN